MNNPLEQLLRQQKKTDLQKKVGYVGPMVGDVPREFGEGDHFVQLAYITPDEAAILKELDLYGSNPPHTGPEIENIPNYNDFGEGSMNASGSQMSAAERGDVTGSGLSASDVAGIQGGYNAAAGGQQTSQDFMDSNQNTNTTSTTPVQDEDETQYTNNIFEAMFTPMKFKYDPKMDYVKGKYGQLPGYKKQQFLDSIGYTEDFDSFLNEYKDDIYNDQNLTFGDIGEMPGKIYNYFTGIPNAINTAATNLTQPGAYQTMAENVFSGVFNPITSFMSGNLPMMFASLAFGKGPYNMEQKMVKGEMQDFATGDIANLANAPADYVQAVKNVQGGTLNAEQISQMAQGFANQQEQQEATRGPQDIPIDQATLDQQSMQQFLDGLSASEVARYEQLINAGYTDDYAKAYLGLM